MCVWRKQEGSLSQLAIGRRRVALSRSLKNVVQLLGARWRLRAVEMMKKERGEKREMFRREHGENQCTSVLIV